MEDLYAVLIAIVAIFLMFVVGLDLSGADFRRVTQHPRVVFVATVAQITVLPAIAALLIVVLEPPPQVAAGMILVAAASGGGISNVFTMVAGANTALSVTLTAISGLLSTVTMPLLTAAGFALLLSESTIVRPPLGLMVGQLLMLLALPVAAGMAVRHRWPHATAQLKPALVRIAGAGILALLTLIVVKEWAMVQARIGEIAGAAVLYTLCAMGAGYGLGVALQVDRSDRFTLMFELGARNLAVVTAVAAQALGRLDVIVFGAVFFLFETPLSLLAALAYRWLTDGLGSSVRRVSS